MVYLTGLGTPDIAKEQDVENAVGEVVQRLGKIDIMINPACGRIFGYKSGGYRIGEGVRQKVCNKWY